jgi:hypothetical protein
MIFAKEYGQLAFDAFQKSTGEMVMAPIIT